MIYQTKEWRVVVHHEDMSDKREELETSINALGYSCLFCRGYKCVVIERIMAKADANKLDKAITKIIGDST